MDKTNLRITEYRGEQQIDFFGITSFKVQNHGESVIEINTIPIYPGQTKKIIEEDGTQTDFLMIAKFTEEGKLPKFRTIYKQFGNNECVSRNPANLPYAVTLYSHNEGDIIEFSQNQSGETVLLRSFDNGATYSDLNTIALGYIIANVQNTYNDGGAIGTTNIKFQNLSTGEVSQDFSVGNGGGDLEEPRLPVFNLGHHYVVEYDEGGTPSRWMIDFSDEILVTGEFFKPTGRELDIVNIGPRQPYVWYNFNDDTFLPTPGPAVGGGFVLSGNTTGFQSYPLYHYGEGQGYYGPYNGSVL